MNNHRFDKQELVGTDSEYLCLFCYDPLYINFQTEKTICVNPTCIVSQSNPRVITDVQRHPVIDNMRKKSWKRIKRFYIFSLEYLTQKLYAIRMETCHKFFLNTGLTLDHLLGIDYLFTKLSHNQCWGTCTNDEIFELSLQQFFEDYSELQFLEDVESKVYLMDGQANTYKMKYLNVILDIRKMLGIVFKDKHGPEDVNSFYFLERKSRIRKAEGAFDFEILFQNHFGLSITTNHLFKYGYFIAQIHKYPVTTSDLATIFSMWTTCIPGKTCSVEKDYFQSIFDGAQKKNNLNGNFEEFLEKYTSGKNFAPIFVFDGKKYHYDYTTLFIFMMYLFSLNKDTDGTQTLSGYDTLMHQRQDAAKNFEIEIRKKFRTESFTVFPKNDSKKFEPSVNNIQKEFDCIAIDYSKKIIISIDAKYEDIAPSSTVGETMVEQAVLDKRNGVLKHAKEHHERRQFLTSNLKKLPLSINDDFWNYQIHSLVVTKHEPLITKHLTTEIISYEKFKTIDFRTLKKT